MANNTNVYDENQAAPANTVDPNSYQYTNPIIDPYVSGLMESSLKTGNIGDVASLYFRPESYYQGEETRRADVLETGVTATGKAAIDRGAYQIQGLAQKQGKLRSTAPVYNIGQLSEATMLESEALMSQGLLGIYEQVGQQRTAERGISADIFQTGYTGTVNKSIAQLNADTQIAITDSQNTTAMAIAQLEASTTLTGYEKEIGRQELINSGNLAVQTLIDTGQTTRNAADITSTELMNMVSVTTNGITTTIPKDVAINAANITSSEKLGMVQITGDDGEAYYVPTDYALGLVSSKTTKEINMVAIEDENGNTIYVPSNYAIGLADIASMEKLNLIEVTDAKGNKMWLPTDVVVTRESITSSEKLGMVEVTDKDGNKKYVPAGYATALANITSTEKMFYGFNFDEDGKPIWASKENIEYLKSMNPDGIPWDVDVARKELLENARQFDLSLGQDWDKFITNLDWLKEENIINTTAQWDMFKESLEFSIWDRKMTAAEFATTISWAKEETWFNADLAKDLQFQALTADADKFNITTQNGLAMWAGDVWRTMKTLEISTNEQHWYAAQVIRQGNWSLANQTVANFANTIATLLEQPEISGLLTGMDSKTGLEISPGSAAAFTDFFSTGLWDFLYSIYDTDASGGVSTEEGATVYKPGTVIDKFIESVDVKYTSGKNAGTAPVNLADMLKGMKEGTIDILDMVGASEVEDVTVKEITDTPDIKETPGDIYAETYGDVADIDIEPSETLAGYMSKNNITNVGGFDRTKLSGATHNTALELDRVVSGSGYTYKALPEKLKFLYLEAVFGGKDSTQYSYFSRRFDAWQRLEKAKITAGTPTTGGK